MSNVCPVCGYPSLDEPAYDGDAPSLEICPSCFYQFGYDDLDQNITHSECREMWIKKGTPWSGSNKSPIGWDPKQQLLNIGVKV